MIAELLFFLLAQSAPSAAAPESAGDDPIICKGRSESVVGTRIKPKKICMKKSDWEYRERHTQRELQQVNQRGNNPGPALGRDSPPL